jgi:KaiC/GvpD/RAD55 family RecA-like ATPase
VYNLFTDDLGEVLGERVEVPVENVSAICDNLVVTRSRYDGKKLWRDLTVAKTRDHAHDTSVHGFSIGKGGLRLEGGKRKRKRRR